MVSIIHGEKGSGGALRKSYSLSHPSSVLNRWQILWATTWKWAQRKVYDLFWRHDTSFSYSLDKEFINKVF